MVGLYLRDRVWWLKLVRNGIKIGPLSLNTEDPVEALVRAAEIRKDPVLNPGDRLRADVTRFVDDMRDRNIWTAASADAKKPILLWFAESVGQRPAAKITTADVQRFYDAARAEPYKKDAAGKPVKRTVDTVNGYISTIRSFFQWAIEDAKITRENPTEGVKLAKSLGKRREDFCTPELRDRLIEKCPREDLKFVLMMGFHAGLRFNEVCECVPAWVNLKRGLLELRKTPTMNFKDREERTIPMTHGLRKYLTEYGLRKPFMLHPEVKHGKSLHRWDFSQPFGTYMASQNCEWVC